MKKGHRTVFQNAWSQKKQTLSLKKQFCFKKSLQIHMKKGTEPSSKMPEAQKTSTFIEKQFCFKKAYRFIWKRGTEPSSKMPEAKKDQHSHWKNNVVSKKLVNSNEKMPQNRFPKCLKPKKQTLSLKKQFCFKKAYKFIWKNCTGASSKMPEAKKTNTLIEKTILFQKSL